MADLNNTTQLSSQFTFIHAQSMNISNRSSKNALKVVKPQGSFYQRSITFHKEVQLVNLRSLVGYNAPSVFYTQGPEVERK